MLQGDLRLEDVGLRYSQASQEQASSLAGQRCEELCCAPRCEGGMQHSNSSDVVTRFHHVKGVK